MGVNLTLWRIAWMLARGYGSHQAAKDEANQVPDIERHCTEQGHRITKWYTLNDKSASKGEQQTMLDQVVADVKLGIITTVVCSHSDRMERRGPEALFRLLRQVPNAGETDQSTKEPLFGTTDLGGEAMTAFGPSSRTSTRCTWPSRSTQAHNEAARTTPLLPEVSRGDTW